MYNWNSNIVVGEQASMQLSFLGSKGWNTVSYISFSH